ncbi:MAG: hypothetical protein RR326_07930, partial [Stenotrophomonas sp.]
MPLFETAGASDHTDTVLREQPLLTILIAQASLSSRDGRSIFLCSMDFCTSSTQRLLVARTDQKSSKAGVITRVLRGQQADHEDGCKSSRPCSSSPGRRRSMHENKNDAPTSKVFYRPLEASIRW